MARRPQSPAIPLSLFGFFSPGSNVSDCPFLSCSADSARLQHEVTGVQENWSWGRGTVTGKASALGPFTGT